jgi:hypothetical protein
VKILKRQQFHAELLTLCFLLAGMVNYDSAGRYKLSLFWFLLIVVVVLLVHPATAPLFMAGFALFLKLLKLCALLRSQNAQHLLMQTSHGLIHLAA